MMRKGILFLIIMILIADYSFASERSISEQQIRCETKFFDRYENHMDVLLRIRRNIIFHQKEIAINKIQVMLGQHKDLTFENMLLVFQELQQACDIAHINMFTDFEKIMGEYKDEAERDFFRQYLTEKMAFRSKKAEEVVSLSVESSCEQNPLLGKEKSSNKRCKLIEMLISLFGD